jgi:hypothetical protein
MDVQEQIVRVLMEGLKEVMLLYANTGIMHLMIILTVVIN